MEVDHIFIFSNQNGNEADKLRKLGLTEGSSRVHPGQGTTNRKFYFDGFFLEILWVHDEGEVRNKVTAPSKLWQRSQFVKSGHSRFGLCLKYQEQLKSLFTNCLKYRPSYLPDGLHVDVLTHETSPSLPWTFTWQAGKSKPNNEPKNHALGLHKLTGVTFGLPEENSNHEFTEFFTGSSIRFEKHNSPWLTLAFDHQEKNKEVTIEDLSLTVKY